MSALALAALLQLNPWHLHAIEVEEVAEAIGQACSGPVAKPSGEQCVAVLVAMMWVESRLEFYPPYRRTGVGPLQIVQPGACFGSHRIGRPACLPPHELTGPAGVRWGAVVLRWKHGYTRHLRTAVRYYNASAGADEYVARVMQLYRRIL